MSTEGEFSDSDEEMQNQNRGSKKRGYPKPDQDTSGQRKRSHAYAPADVLTMLTSALANAQSHKTILSTPGSKAGNSSSQLLNDNGPSESEDVFSEPFKKKSQSPHSSVTPRRPGNFQTQSQHNPRSHTPRSHTKSTSQTPMGQCLHKPRNIRNPGSESVRNQPTDVSRSFSSSTPRPQPRSPRSQSASTHRSQPSDVSRSFSSSTQPRSPRSQSASTRRNQPNDVSTSSSSSTSRPPSSNSSRNTSGGFLSRSSMSPVSANGDEESSGLVNEDSPGSADEESSERLSIPQMEQAIKDIDRIIGCFDERMKGTEVAVRSLKRSIENSKAASKKKAKQSVPHVVRSETRKIYHTLLDDDEDSFKGFDIGPHATYKDEDNQKVVATLIQEVQGKNKNFKGCDIRAAAYTYYKTLTQGESMKRRGLEDGRKRSRRRRERLIRKLKSRKSVVDKSSLTEREKAKWNKCLTAEFMSSDESDGAAIVIKTLPWRSSIVNDFFKSLDEEAHAKKSEQARRQTKQRLLGDSSLREAPSANAVPSWSVTL